jgi:hypothetical protein
MIILKAIGAFFVKIWRWIKDTAWVQPLLIVGAIFAVIFSIPSITSWASNFNQTSANSFYNVKKQNLEGETYSSSSDSPADKLMNSIYHCYNNGTPTTFDATTKNFGDKYYLIFADSTNATSKTIESSFKYLSDNWNQYGLVPSDKGSFNYYTIFKDDTSSNDDDFTDNGSAFQRFLSIHIDLFQSVTPNLKNDPYKLRATIADDNYTKFGFDDSSAVDSFPVPNVCLVDYSADAIKDGRAGLSEVLFTVTGDTDAARATLLMNMWNHTDAYSTTNLFTRLA